jgi:hypothetical protein
VSVWEGRSVDDWRRMWRLPALHIYLRVGSTNDVARQLALEGAPDGTVVLADEQTRGRGGGPPPRAPTPHPTPPAL